jgi:GST-like protein
VTSGGEVLAESLAITLWLAETNDSEDWVPLPTARCRGRFLRWLTFCVSSLYPTFTYADDPARFVPMAAAQAGFVERVAAFRERLWRMLEAESGTPWFLGERMSAIDLYIAVMSRWRPGRAWCAEHAPRLHAIALAVDALPAVDAVLARHFPAAAPEL